MYCRWILRLMQDSAHVLQVGHRDTLLYGKRRPGPGGPAHYSWTTISLMRWARTTSPSKSVYRCVFPTDGVFESLAMMMGCAARRVYCLRWRRRSWTLAPPCATLGITTGRQWADMGHQGVAWNICGFGLNPADGSRPARHTSHDRRRHHPEENGRAAAVPLERGRHGAMAVVRARPAFR